MSKSPKGRRPTEKTALEFDAYGDTALRSVVKRLGLYARAHAIQDGKLRLEICLVLMVTILTLPLSLMSASPENERILRILTALLAAHVSLGAFVLCLDDIDGTWPEKRKDELDVERLFRSFSNPVLASDLFGLFEDKRVRAIVAKRYPGLGRELHILPTLWEPKNTSDSIQLQLKGCSIHFGSVLIMSSQHRVFLIPFKAFMLGWPRDWMH